MKKLLVCITFACLCTLPVKAQTNTGGYRVVFNNALTRTVLRADSLGTDSLRTKTNQNQSLISPTNLEGTVPTVRPVVADAGITRRTDSVVTLDVANVSYLIRSSKQLPQFAENVYVAQEGTGSLTIRKIYATTNQAAITAFLGKHKALTDDNRWEEDRVVSYEDKTGRNIYRAGRFLQVGNGVLAIQIEVKKTGLTNEQWTELKQDILSALSNTPANVFTEHFVERNCTFGTDFR